MKKYRTIDDLIEEGKARGATHVSFSNWHEGAFWYVGPRPKVNIPAVLEEVIEEREGPGWRTKPTVQRIMPFHDALSHWTDFINWRLDDDWDEAWGIPWPCSQLMPIEEALDYYLTWNTAYIPGWRGVFASTKRYLAWRLKRRGC